MITLIKTWLNFCSISVKFLFLFIPYRFWDWKYVLTLWWGMKCDEVSLVDKENE